jgi:hypothetical protein
MDEVDRMDRMDGKEPGRRAALRLVLKPILCLVALVLVHLSGARAATVGDSLRSAPPPRRPREAATSPSLPLWRPEIRYTAEQIETILARANSAWRGYLRLRPQLRTVDAREQAFAKKAAALRAMSLAVRRLLDSEKRNPTKEGVQTVADALSSLDRASVAVEYDSDRISLRLAQESVLPPNQRYCLCVAPSFARISPVAPTACSPANSHALSLAAGEAESFQLVIVPYWESLRGVRVEVSDLFHRDSIGRFSQSQIRLWVVESVATTPTVGRAEYLPDPLTPLRTFDLPASVSQTILVDIRARKNQGAGLYEGHLTVRPENLPATSIPLRVLVRPFALPEGVPQVAFRAKNVSIQQQLAASPLSRFARQWDVFLEDYGLRLYPQSAPDDPAAGWLSWMGEDVPAPAESPALVSCLAFRQAAWGAWIENRRLGLATPRWLLNGWVSLDVSSAEPRLAAAKRSGEAGSAVAPFVRSRGEAGEPDNAPGLVCVNPRGELEPTIRLIALRDGIEDHAYLELLSRKIAETKLRRAAGWWKRRGWSGLLNFRPSLADPARASPDTASDILDLREAVAQAIEKAQGCLDREGNRQK